MIQRRNVNRSTENMSWSFLFLLLRSSSIFAYAVRTWSLYTTPYGPGLRWWTKVDIIASENRTDQPNWMKTVPAGERLIDVLALGFPGWPCRADRVAPCALDIDTGGSDFWGPPAFHIHIHTYCAGHNASALMERSQCMVVLPLTACMSVAGDGPNTTCYLPRRTGRSRTWGWTFF